MKNVLETLNSLKNAQKSHNNIFRPEIYRLSQEKDLSRFTSILQNPGITIVDFLNDQVKELIKFKTPSKKYSGPELDLLVKQHIGESQDQYGVWVYYPWSNRLVHILDEEEFVTVRTSRNQYKITPEEKQVLSAKKIGVIGLSVGQSVSVTLAMERICGELRLADFDILELTNLNRIRTGIHNLGLPKVYSVAREIAEIDPFLKVICFPDGLHEKNMDEFFTGGGNLDLLVEESDGFDIKILSRYKARSLRIPVIMEGSDRCLVDVERFDLEPDRSILHGLVNHLDIDLLKTLRTNEEKIPYMLDILGIESASLRLKASMLEIDQSINTWPQLASAVTMGGGITADVSRRMLLNQYTKSGRYHIDIEELIGNDTPAEENKVPQARYKVQTMRELSDLCDLKPADGQATLSRDEAEAIVKAGSLAPSGGNAQPWRFIYKNNILYVFNGVDATDNMLGYDNLSSYVALGAAAQNIVLKSAELSLRADLEFFPVKGQPQLVLAIKFTKEQHVETDKDLASAIGYRLTNRLLGARPNIESNILDGLKKEADNFPGFSVNIFSDEKELDEIAELLGELERLRLMEETGHRDFVAEIRWTDKENEEKKDGIDIRTLDISNSERVGLEVARDQQIIGLLKKWRGGGAFKKLTRKSIDAAGAVGVIIADKSSHENFVRGGMLLEKLWLRANASGVSFQPMAASVFLYARAIHGKGKDLSSEGVGALQNLRARYENAFSIPRGKQEIFIFRLAKAAKPEVMSLRKPLNEVFCYL